MSALTRLAFETLQDSAAAPGLKSVACTTLLHAMEQAVDVPVGCHVAVWRHLLASEGSAATLHRHEIPHRDVARDAIRVLLDGEAGEGAQDLALAALRGPNVGQITNDDLFTIADRVLDEGRVRRVGWLVEQVHEDRGLSPAFIRALRDRLAGSTLAVVRAAAAEVGGLLARLDGPFTMRLLGDESPLVRAAAAEQLEKAEPLDQPRALALVRQHLAIEHHRTVVSACHHALGSLVRSSGRRVRQSETPGGDEN